MPVLIDSSPAAEPAQTRARSNPVAGADVPVAVAAAPRRPREIGGPAGLEPTRYGDWEKLGRCIDF
ncbi:MAG: DUF1674 domain-containing protein [Steroidobacterales bacterium]